MEQNGSNGSGGGNTISPPIARKSGSKYWCFTFNNYTKMEMDQMEQAFKQLEVKYVFGREVGESGTPHLQGYIECPKKTQTIRGIQNKKDTLGKAQRNKYAKHYILYQGRRLYNKYGHTKTVNESDKV